MKRFTTALLFISLSLGIVAQSFAQGEAKASGSLSAAFSSWGSASVSGDWKIIEESGKTFIELADNFKAKSGPDVKIFLSPTQSDAVTGSNATDGSVFVKQIHSFSGATRIEIPAGVDLNDFQSLVFHCEAYSKLWGTSALNVFGS